MIQIIVIAASILLGMFLYPIVRRTYTRFITEQYKKLVVETSFVKEPEEKPIKTEPKHSEKPSIIGKSKFILSQSKPNTATALETENREKKEPIFAPETGEESPLMGVSVPLEKIEKAETAEDGMNEEEEEISLYTDGESYSAGGASFEELMQVKEVIEKSVPTKEEERQAGRILYENQETEIIEKLLSGNQKINLKVSTLIQFHLDEHEKEQRMKTGTVEETNDNDSDEFAGFDFNKIL